MALTAFALEMVALWFQHVMGLKPCVLCIYERCALFGVMGAGLLGAIAPKTPLRYVAIAVWLYSAWKGIELSWQHTMMWGNIKGSLTMALVISLPVGLPYRNELITIAFGVVLLSLLVQGLTLGSWVKWLRLGSVSGLRQRFERQQLKVIGSRAAQAEV